MTRYITLLLACLFAASAAFAQAPAKPAAASMTPDEKAAKT